MPDDTLEQRRLVRMAKRRRKATLELTLQELAHVLDKTAGLRRLADISDEDWNAAAAQDARTADNAA